MTRAADAEAVLAEIRRRRDELIRLAADLIRFRTENPPADTREIVQFIQGYLEEAGVRFACYEPLPGLVSLVADVRGGHGRTLAFNGHLDVVPAGNLAEWRVDPFSGDVAGGNLWGRGAADMKSKVAAALFVARVLQEQGMPLPGTWQLMLVPDEESGGEHGTKWLVEQGVVHPDAAVVGEGAGRHYGIANKGSLTVKIAAEGRTAHGSRPFEGKNAVEILAAALPRLHDLELWEPVLPSALTEIIEQSRPFHEENARKRGVPVERYLWSLGHVTVNVGTFHGGVARNVVPDAAAAEVDIRIPPTIDSTAVLTRLEDILHAPGMPELSTAVTMRSESFYQSPDAEIVRVARAALKELEISPDPRPVFKASGNDCRHLKPAGIPCVVLGHDGSGGHVPNEHCSLDELVSTACLYALVTHRFLTQGGSAADGGRDG